MNSQQIHETLAECKEQEGGSGGDQYRKSLSISTTWDFLRLTPCSTQQWSVGHGQTFLLPVDFSRRGGSRRAVYADHGPGGSEDEVGAVSSHHFSLVNPLLL